MCGQMSGLWTRGLNAALNPVLLHWLHRLLYCGDLTAGLAGMAGGPPDAARPPAVVSAALGPLFPRTWSAVECREKGCRACDCDRTEQELFVRGRGRFTSARLPTLDCGPLSVSLSRGPQMQGSDRCLSCYICSAAVLDALLDGRHLSFCLLLVFTDTLEVRGPTLGLSSLLSVAPSVDATGLSTDALP